MNKLIALLIISLLVFTVSFAQVGIGTTTPEATLDIRGANHDTTGAVASGDGLLVPRVTDLVAAGLADGQMVYLLNDVGFQKKGFYNWNGTGWTPLAATSSPSFAGNIVAPDASFPLPPTSFTISPGTAILDNTGYSYTIPVSGITGNTSFVSININITHTWVSDLDIFLEAPTGQILELSTDNGGSGSNYTNTTFIDTAGSNIGAGTAPFTGTFIPEGSVTASGAPLNLTATITNLAGFNGLNGNGNWILRVGDGAGGDTGTMNSATLNISGAGSVDWVLIGETSITYNSDTALIVQSSYSGDTSDRNGVVTSMTRTTATAGVVGSTAASLPGSILNYASASPSGTGNYWVNTFNQTRDIGLANNTVYFYQLWRKGNIESPIASNQTHSLIPFRVKQ